MKTVLGRVVSRINADIRRAQYTAEEARGRAAGGRGSASPGLRLPAETIPTQANNLLRNGDGDYNRNDWLYAADHASADVDHECAHVYTHGAYAAGVQLHEDATDANADGDAARTHALLHRTHALYSSGANVNDPDWDKVNGHFRLGSANLLDFPLSTNKIRPGKKYYLSFIALLQPEVDDAGITAADTTLTSATAGFVAGDVGKRVVVAGAGAAGADLDTTIASFTSASEVELADAAGTTVANANAKFSGSLDAAVRFVAGVYDNAAGAGHRQWLEAASATFAVTAALVGAAGATSRNFRVLATTDWLETYLTAAVNVANSPSDAQFNSANRYLRLEWPRVPGATKYEVYAESGGVYKRVYETDVGLRFDYYAQTPLETVAGWPAADYGDTPRAFAAFRANRFVPNSYLTSQTWKEFLLPLEVPTPLSVSVDTTQQWLRMGLSAALSGAGMKRALRIDLVQLATDPGKYSDWVADVDGGAPKRGPSVSMSDSTQGGIGTGGGGAGTEPGGGGGGGERCVALSSSFLVLGASGAEYELPARKLERGMVVLTGGGRAAVVRKVEVTEPVEVFEALSERGVRQRGSASHRIVASAGDRRGKALAGVRPGDPWRTYVRGQFWADRVKSVRKAKRRERVVKIYLSHIDHTYLARTGRSAGHGACHNLKAALETI